MKRLVVLFFVCISYTLTATAQDVVEQELKRFSDIVATSDTLKIRELQTEYVSKVPNYSEGEEEYALYNMLAGMSSFCLGEIEKSIPNLRLAYKGLISLSPQPEAINYFLSLVCGYLGCAYAYTDRQNDAISYIDCSSLYAKKVKNENRAALVVVIQCHAAAYSKLGLYQKAYQAIHQMKDEVLKLSGQAIYVEVLSQMAKLAADNNQYKKIKGYYKELSDILSQHPDSSSVSVIEDTFIVDIISYLLPKTKDYAEDTCRKLLELKYNGFLQFTEKDFYISYELYCLYQYLSLAKTADRNNNAETTIFFAEQLLKIDKSLLPFDKWVIAMFWVAHYQVKYQDKYKEAIDLLYNVLVSSEHNDMGAELKNDIVATILHYVHRSVNVIRKFRSTPIGEKHSDSYMPILPAETVMNIITKWIEISQYTTEHYGGQFLENILQSEPFSKNIFSQTAYSTGDIQLVLAKYYVYYQQYSKFDETYQKLVDNYKITTNQQLDLLYVISEGLYQNKNSAEAYLFLNHIKNNVSYTSNSEIAKEVEQRIQELENWIERNLAVAQYYAREGQVDTACELYDELLNYANKVYGKKSEYIKILNRKADSLCAANKYAEAITYALMALELIGLHSPGDFVEKYTSLATIYISYSGQQEYSKAIPYLIDALKLLQYRYQNNLVYNKLEQIILVYTHLIAAYDKLGEVNERSKIIFKASQFLAQNYGEVKKLQNGYLSAQSIIGYAIQNHMDICGEAADKDNYQQCITSYNDALTLLEYSIWSYHHIYYGKKESTIEYLLKTTYIQDRNLFFKIIEDYWKYTELCYNSHVKNGILCKDILYQEISECYTRLAQICYLNYLPDGATYVNNKLLKYLSDHNIDNPHNFIEIYNMMANIYQRQLKDYGKSMEYHIKSINASIGANGYHHNASFDSFDKAQNMYSVCSSFETRIYNLNVNKDGYCKTFEDDLKLYTLWYNAQNALAKKYGDGYLQSLYKYNYNANREFDIKNQGSPRPHSMKDDLDWKGQMTYDKIYLSILYNRVDDFEKSINELWAHLGTLKAYPFIVGVANVLSERGYYDHAIWLLEAFGHSIINKENVDIWAPIVENINYSLAGIAWDYNRYDDAIHYLQPLELEMYVYLAGGSKEISWYDTQTIIQGLSLLAQFYAVVDEAKANKCIELIENIISNNLIGKNGKPLKDDVIADMYNMLCLIATDYNEKEQYLLNAIKHSSKWNYVYNINLAQVYTKSGQYEKANAILPQILEYAHNNYLIDDFRGLVLSCTTLNAIWKKDSVKAKTESRKRFDLAVKMYLQKSQTLTSESRSTFWDYSFGNTLKWFSMVDLVNDGDASVSYDAALFHKGILLSQRSMIDKNIRTSSDEELKIAHNKYLDAIKRQTDSIEMCESQMMYLYSKHPEFVDNFKPAKWQDVQSCLGKKDVAIEFALTEESPMSKPKFVALLLSHDAPNPIVVPLCNEEQLRNAITNDTNTTGYLNLYDKPILYELIWQPLEQCLKGVKNIYFAPYDVLNNINFSAIKIGNTKKRLMDVYKLHRLSSTAQLYNGFAENKLCNVVAFGGVDYNNYQDTITKHATSAIPTAKKEDESFSDMRGYVKEWNFLSGAESEVKNIRHILSKSNISTQIYTYTNASEENFKKMSGDSISIVHLATHGFYFTPNDAKKMIFFNNPREDMSKNMDSGARSGLILSGGNLAWKGEVVAGKEDGVLTSKEILGMDLSSIDLMVLSACQTALGDIRNDGVYGMQRNLKMAGANTMIISLWEVNDAATKEIMSTFYGYIAKGYDKREAFDKAVSESRKKNKDNCELWAPFVLLD